MARRLKFSSPRVRDCVAALVVFGLLGGAFAHNYQHQALHRRDALNARTLGVLIGMAETFAKLDESQVRVATVETLAEPGADERLGRTYGFELQGSAPHWEGTRFVAFRDGHEAATLTIQSASQRQWTYGTEPIPEWWQVWK